MSESSKSGDHINTVFNVPVKSQQSQESHPSEGRPSASLQHPEAQLFVPENQRTNASSASSHA